MSILEQQCHDDLKNSIWKCGGLFNAYAEEVVFG